MKGNKIMEREEKQERLKELRQETGMNRRGFSEKFGIPYPTITDWELGHRRVPDYLLRLLTYKIKMDAYALKKQEENSFVTISFTRDDVRDILKKRGVDDSEQAVDEFIAGLDLAEFKKQCINDGKKRLEKLSNNLKLK